MKENSELKKSRQNNTKSNKKLSSLSSSELQTERQSQLSYLIQQNVELARENRRLKKILFGSSTFFSPVPTTSENFVFSQSPKCIALQSPSYLPSSIFDLSQIQSSISLESLSLHKTFRQSSHNSQKVESESNIPSDTEEPECETKLSTNEEFPDLEKKPELIIRHFSTRPLPSFSCDTELSPRLNCKMQTKSEDLNAVYYREMECQITRDFSQCRSLNQVLEVTEPEVVFCTDALSTLGEKHQFYSQFIQSKTTPHIVV